MATKMKSLSKSGVFYLLYNISNIAFPFFTGIYVARIITPDLIGKITAAQNLAQYFIVFAFWGIPTYGLREIARTRNEREERNQLYSELIFINFISTCFFSCIYILTIFIFDIYRSNINLYLIIGITVVLNIFNNSWLYEGLEEYSFIAIRNFIFKVFCFVLLILFVKKSSDYLVYAAITVLGVAGNNIVNILFTPKYASFSLKNLNLQRHLKPLLFLVVVNLSIEIYSLVDITMMNFICSNEHIAYYKYGSNIYKILLQIVNMVTIVIVPRLSFYYRKNEKEKYNQLVSKGLKIIILTSIPMIIGIRFTAGFLISKIYGMDYASSSTVLKYLSILLFISPIGYLLGSRMLLITGNENKMFIPVGIGAIVNIVGNALFIPIYQEIGATIASVLSEVVVMCVYLFLGRKYYELKGIKDTCLKVPLVSGVMIAYLIICTRLHIGGWATTFLQISGSIILYLIGLCILKEEVTYSYMIFIKRKIAGC